MTQIEAFTKELEKEVTATRKMLSIVPADKFDWAPHTKSMELKKLVTHIAELPMWIGMVFNTSELDFETGEYQPEDVKSADELVNYFDRAIADAKKHLAEGKEESLTEIWTLRSGDIIHSQESKWDVIRMSISQIIHHRAQLGVYLRLLNVPIPGSYGPSADDMSF